MDMRKKIHDFVWVIYRMMQRHYVTFRFLMWLKRLGIMRGISYRLWRFNHKDVRAAAEKQKSAEFFAANVERAERVLSMLADEKSRTVLGGGNTL